MARIVAIDYGKKRTGIAISDPFQIIAQGLATVPTSSLLAFLLDYISKEVVERVIIGEPRQPDGSPSDTFLHVKQFILTWQKAVPNIPIDCYDERFTSVLAHKVMLDAGIGRKKRRNKALVDKISATIILEDYMQSRCTKKE